VASKDEGTKRRTGCARPLKDYVAIYSTALRTVKRWVATGKEKGDPAPLDDPEGMMAWWSRVSPQKAPDGIMQAVIEVRKGKPAAAVVEAEPVNEPVDENQDELGLEWTLKRLEEAERILSKKVHQPGQAKPWLDTVSRMAATSKALREEMEKQGKLVPKDAAAAVIQEVNGPIERGMRGMYRTFCEVTGIPMVPETEERWLKEMDRLFLRFKEEVFRCG